jgi:dynein heavy chain
MDDMLALPYEIHHLIFQGLSLEQLCALRGVSRESQAIVARTLRNRVEMHLSLLKQQRSEIQDQLNTREKVSAPNLRHYRSFLQQISLNEISEAMWYSSPPRELQIVCECLCILKLGNLCNRLEWRSTKVALSKYEFKHWLSNLKTNVQRIPIENVKRVENIIANDSSITYERLRDVSMAGYRLLIYVAATIQYAKLHNELRVLKNRLEEIDKRSSSLSRFLMICNF